MRSRGHESAPSPGFAAGIVLAAGSSTRMGFDKLWAPLGGQPVVAWSLRVFASSPLLGQLVVATAPGTEQRMAELLDSLRIEAVVVAGGERRQDSVRLALGACPAAEWVLVHDAARPLVTADLLRTGLREAQETGAAIAAVPTLDTIKVVRDSSIVSTPDRNSLWAAQTPQVFRRTLLVEAHERGRDAAVSDDAMLVEALGVRVRVFPGAYGNIKITTPVDLRIAAALLVAREEPPAVQTDAPIDDEAQGR